MIPNSIIEDGKQYDATLSIPNVHVPILFIAGEKDVIVPFDEIKNLYDIANEPKKLIVIPGIGHDYRKNPDEVRLVNNAIMKHL